MSADGETGGPRKGGPESEVTPETSEGAGAGEPGSEGGEGSRNMKRTPKLDQGGEGGKTQSPAPADDVGVPEDEEINEEEDSG